MEGQDTLKIISNLREQVNGVSLPPELKGRLIVRLERLERIVGTPLAFEELDRTANYIDWTVSLPWTKPGDDILDLEYAKKILDKNHFGLEDMKDRILEFISVIKLNKEKGNRTKSPILSFVGLAGTGKTTVAYSVAEALGKKFYRIPFGGMGDPQELRGQSKVVPEAEPGRVMKALKSVNVKNPVILLDEIDRVDEEKRATIMGVLVELLDPEQNVNFVDHYIDYPFDLSEVLFITTGNNTTNIATAVLDRLEVIHMPSYTDDQKINIGKNYMLPKVIAQSGLPKEAVILDDNVWINIVRPLGFDAGMRTLERTIDGIVRKVAREVVEGKLTGIHLTDQNIKQYLPR
ncbi:MAG: hypothetical protein A3D24_02945 [Candidatus Blackburnbacteria bacterium RIFCSPHIGHO2_02_FULL_39_13]|uniref:AAA+ ATPase domain-containing protein n=1 Tax=Candidatus Blackburnbacteria bacterium RIFCSPLOWO2_01_FULL_40_20 TaxID=1797519 RepID=A0A1G1VB47_9BACT|nr:MAG: Lon protease [Microgenomates group bacterium GW2011_GWA2_39_19]OGY07438.1 MAG: hypothetical protein A2694_00250 [Candidatus Blackburnbacteria bacterium RIFCSPHIGHO2_01_FULL_40_17]OGY08440.1 MAG: hypothetical protein A3D24_02945 [Candidatus Blackburnbacteria bacterium RIFCSPHIGHO2_02_FULL_39_13]OGY12613.1 MAG: hypothetical protein A3A77_05035 [Candidatus Blackburnbacteria bacterium RIFCSPLOWO2_01_FULL_40_20]OGY14902.1 MAG: hypothetical protein A3I52_02505 [Candidatus Blackburnbacteria ba